MSKLERLEKELKVWKNALMNSRTTEQALEISNELEKIKRQINEAEK
jgi:hypothetical protein